MSEPEAGGPAYAEASGLRGWLLRHIEELGASRRVRFDRAAPRIERAVRAEKAVIADVGCEEGILGRRLGPRHPGWTVVGIDLDHDSLRRGLSECRAAGVTNTVFVRHDAQRPLRAGAFDAVVALESLSQIPDDGAALRSFAEMLRPGGRFLCHVPNAGWTPVLRGSPHKWRNEVRHGYRPEDFRALAASAGLHVETVLATTFAPLQLVDELDYRLAQSSVRVRAVVWAAALVVGRLERLGVRCGRPRAWLVEGRRR